MVILINDYGTIVI